jgi:hypothetical protein
MSDLLWKVLHSAAVLLLLGNVIKGPQGPVLGRARTAVP